MFTPTKRAVRFEPVRTHRSFALRATVLVALLLCCRTGEAQTDAHSEPRASTQPDPSSADPNAPRPAKSKNEPKPWQLKPPEVSGYVQVHYRYSFETGVDGALDFSDFRVQRVRVMFKGEVFPWLSYDVEVDPRAPEVKGLLRDAYFALKLIPRHEIRIGQQKTLFGFENRESSSELYVVNRTELSDSLSRGKNLRDIGIGLRGNLKLGGGFRLEDAITVVNGAGFNVQADDTAKKNVWGRVGLRYKQDNASQLVARLGVSGAIGDALDEGVLEFDPTDDFRLEFKRLGLDVEVDHRWFFLSTEYVKGWDDNTQTGDSEQKHGYYLQLVGKTRWQVGPVVRLDSFADEFRRWTLGAYYGLPSERFRVILNYEIRELKDGVRGDDRLYLSTQVRF